ncbi:hypothetical protein HZQ57_14040 [Elizabethkingia anophelis]|uniref:Glycosyltransferase family 25 (LPS biosynthesis protein) n=1 Tax=Elizabethkingia miricola TaxID=172045 RepID=A0ABD5B409_ELIMR|nr:hypothetical protein [Elizabethkingia miricola]MCT3806333.1 hypothetical protein [Elizabethkingia anophelis]MCT3813519.1 hypothetical protein [Elizabethkingia anophelis]MCT3820614.1 hypothetical protein [Elizabethkingia anophelis]MDQ8747823.1 hypothetical protein [Elizabethkingia miricola]
MLPVYIINLRKRKDRYKSIQSEFHNQKNFYLIYQKVNLGKKSNVALWNNIKRCIKEAKSNKYEFIIICEDDHIFTKHYDWNFLINNINKSKLLKADLLSGGVSWFKHAIQIEENLFWIDKFNGCQFLVIFKDAYDKILNTTFLDSDFADYKLSEILDRKFLIFPFISSQQEFGYSDVTPKNDGTDRVIDLFNKSLERLSIMSKIKKNYFKS